GQEVVLPERYRPRLAQRQDVRYLADKVEWASDDDAALAAADGAVITRRPIDQVRFASGLLANSNITRLLLEKPLAPTPEEARRIGESLAAFGAPYRIGYNFRLTGWGKQLLKFMQRPHPDGALEIIWQFNAHHYAFRLDNWKRHISQ